MTNRIKPILMATIIAGFGLFDGVQSSVHDANAQSYVRPEMIVVKFRAEWCGPCKVMEPALDQALSALADPSIRLVNIDTTNGATSQAAAHHAFDADIVSQYNQWLGITGFAAIIDADTKNTLGCVNMTYSADMMATHIANLKSLALSNTPNIDLTCPGPNR